MGVEEWLLLDGIALRAADISPGNVELAAAVVADFADARLAFGDGATVSAGEAAEAIVFEFLAESRIGLADADVEDVAEGGHWWLTVILPLPGAAVVGRWSSALSAGVVALEDFTKLLTAKLGEENLAKIAKMGVQPVRSSLV
jgi:hypothetical protein